MPKSLYIIDGHSQIFRAYYAPFRSLTSPAGEPTRATYVFTQMLLNLIRDRRPEYLVMVLDAEKGISPRRAIYPEYKATRQATPEDLPPQERRIISILETASVPVLQAPGHEADDVIATLVRRLAGPAYEVVLVSRDKDLDQLLRPGVVMYDPMKDETITAERLPELKGWTATQAVDAQTLTGDSTDNVPGVPGIGPKTAAKLLQQYGSLANILAHVDELKPAQRAAFKSHAAQLEINRQLVRLQDDVPFDFDLERAACANFTWSRVRSIFEELGFRRMVDQLPRGDETCGTEVGKWGSGEVGKGERASAADGANERRPVATGGTEVGKWESGEVGKGEHASAADSANERRPVATGGTEVGKWGSGEVGKGEHASAADGADEPRPVATGQQELFAPDPTGGADTPLPTSPPPHLPTAEAARPEPRPPAAAALREPAGGEYRLVNTGEKLSELAARLQEQAEFALDTETTGQNPMDCELVGLSFAWEVGRAYYVPVRCVFGNCLALDAARAQLGPPLADPLKRKIGQHLKFDLNVLRNEGIAVAGPLFDTMVASFVLNPLRGSHGLDSLAFNLLGYTKTPTTDLIGKGRDQIRMDQVPLERIAEYAGEDADYTWRLGRLFEPQLAPLGLDRLFHDVEMPLLRVLTDMEAEGVRIDVDFLGEMSRRMADQAAALLQQIQAAAGIEFNPDSPKQLAEVLFDRLCLPVIRRTKTTRSTDADTLEELKKQTNHPVCELLLQYREIQKLRGTYVDALPREISRRTGRVHTSFSQTGAVTGRLSSSDPNLQNIPIRTETGREIRRAFVPRTADDLLVVADYSQVELRVLAHFSRDEALTQAFVADRDIHAFVAAQVNGVPLESVTKDMRGRAKAVNFGIVYGQSAFGLSQQTGMSRTEAQAFIHAYFDRYPRIRAFIDQTVAEAKLHGFVRTILGRRRTIENIASRTNSLRAQAERFAVNTVIQGSAADLIKLAMIRLHARIRDERLPLRMLLQVHDELVCEAPRAAAPAMAEIVRSVMTTAMPELRVPLKVDVACGANWLEAK